MYAGCGLENRVYDYHDLSSSSYCFSSCSNYDNGSERLLYSMAQQSQPAYVSSNSQSRQMDYSNSSVPAYSSTENKEQESITQTHAYLTIPFLNPQRVTTRFVNTTDEVQEIVEEIFKQTTGHELPENIVINVCSLEELREVHSRFSDNFSFGIQGFALNRKPFVSEIFVKQDNLDSLILTIGHELGHVLTFNLGNHHEEEAKAFAFELAWIRTILLHDIAGLASSINNDILNPARNGLHDIAFGFVCGLIKNGKNALDIYWELVTGALNFYPELDF